MKLLYALAAYGDQELANIVHREVGEIFLARGHQFSVFALASSRQIGARSRDTIEDNIPVHRAVAAGRVPDDLTNRATRPFFQYDRFATGVVRFRSYLSHHPAPDVIYAEGVYPFGAMISASVRGPQPRILITVAGGDFIASSSAEYGYGRFRVARALMHYAFRRSAAVRVTTPLARDRAIALGALPDKITIIPRNIANYCFPPEGQDIQSYRQDMRSLIAARLGTANAHLIMAAGRLLPIKGFDNLIRALPDVVESAGDTKLLLMGPNRFTSRFGDYQVYLTRLAAECGVADRVMFIGTVPHPEVRSYLAAADIIAVPSVMEGMNKIAVEAAAVGTPSLVTRTSGISDLMAAAHVGEIVEPDDVQALAARLGERLRRPDASDTRQRELEWARQFTSTVVGNQLVDLCESILSGAGADRAER